MNFYFLGILMSYYDDFLQFKRLSKKSKQLKFTMTMDLGKKWNFLHIHNFADSAAEWMNIYILGILMSYHDCSQQFKRLSEESKKNRKFFMTADLLKNGIFFGYAHFCRFCSQISEFLLLRYPDVIFSWFYLIKRLSKKSKKLKFFMTVDLSKNVIFWIFTFLQILQPNEWIFTF